MHPELATPRNDLSLTGAADKETPTFKGGRMSDIRLQFHI